MSAADVQLPTPTQLQKKSDAGKERIRAEKALRDERQVKALLELFVEMAELVTGEGLYKTTIRIPKSDGRHVVDRVATELRAQKFKVDVMPARTLSHIGWFIDVSWKPSKRD